MKPCFLPVLAALGVVLPGLPTTPFLLVAAACFVRSSQRLYDRLLAHPVFGPLVRDYRDVDGTALDWSASWTDGGVAIGAPTSCPRT